jgi:hypothetical protein
MVLSVDLEAEKAAALLLGSDKGGAGTGAGVEYHAMRRAEHRNEGC